jgi:hypothetical protein
MDPQKRFRVPFAKTALRALCALSLAAVGCSSGSGGSSGSGSATSDGGGSSGGGSAFSATDQLTVLAGGQSYQYQCAEQSLDQTAGPRIVTTGCNWPSANPRIEIDFAVQGGEPLENVTIDLSAPTSTSSILFTVGLSEQSNAANVSIYPAFATGGATVASGTSGTVTVRSYDPSSGHMNIVATNVTLAVAADFNSYPAAPSTVTVLNAEIVR